VRARARERVRVRVRVRVSRARVRVCVCVCRARANLEKKVYFEKYVTSKDITLLRDEFFVAYYYPGIHILVNKQIISFMYDCVNTLTIHNFGILEFIETFVPQFFILVQLIFTEMPYKNF
jgi:hypothetical protein